MKLRLFITFVAAMSFSAWFHRAAADPLDHWTPSPSRIHSNLTSLAYGNGVFVATASSGSNGGWLGYSTDGTHWNAASCGGQACTPTAQFCVTYANNRFVAVGDYGWTYTSTNGVDWRVNVVPPSDSILWNICYGNGQFVAAGQMDTCPCGFLPVSTDGAQWTPVYIEDIAYLRGIAFGNGRFVAVGLSDYSGRHIPSAIFSSTNVLTRWTSYAAATTNDYFSVTHGSGMFVAVGEEHYS